MNLKIGSLIEKKSFQTLKKIIDSVCFESEVATYTLKEILNIDENSKVPNVLFIDYDELEMSISDFLKLYSNNKILNSIPIIFIANYPYDIDLQMIITFPNIKGILRKYLDSTEVYLLLRTLFCENSSS